MSSLPCLGFGFKDEASTKACIEDDLDELGTSKRVKPPSEGEISYTSQSIVFKSPGLGQQKRGLVPSFSEVPVPLTYWTSRALA